MDIICYCGAEITGILPVIIFFEGDQVASRVELNEAITLRCWNGHIAGQSHDGRPSEWPELRKTVALALGCEP